MKWQEVVGLIRFTEAEFQELEQFMLSQYGIDLSKKRTLSECRLSAELEKEGITSLQQFMRRMEQDDAPLQLEFSGIMIASLLII